MAEGRFGLLLAGLIFLLLVFFLADLLLGSVNIPFPAIMKMLLGSRAGATAGMPREWSAILFEFRLPRALTAVMGGCALSLAGLQMQTVFRNPLAGPYVLGISAGASLGVAILIMGAGMILQRVDSHHPHHGAIILAAWMGAAGVLALLLLVSLRIRDILTILILGILFGAITTALVSILQYFSHESQLKSFILWTLGSLGHVTRGQLPVFSGSILAGILISVFSIKILNAFLLGENYARSLGIPVLTGRILIFISTSILAGTITAFCGPIGFIGIAVPHLARLVLRSADHRRLIPVCLLLGAVVLLISDIISQVPGSDRVLPINSVTALIGIPVVIWIVIKNQRFSNVTAQ